MKTKLLILNLNVFYIFCLSIGNAEPKNQIRWNNGETIPGEIVSASAKDVTWQNPAFTEPVTVRWGALRRIDRQPTNSAVTDGFSLVLRDGSRIYGDITAITEKTIAVKSIRHGDAVLKRSQVLHAQRLRGGALTYNGPTNISEWRLNKTSPKTKSPLAIVDGGAMHIKYWNRSAFLNLDTPDERAEVAFQIRSKQRPEFKCSISAGAQKLALETWDNELVLTCNDNYISVRQLNEETRDLELHLCWNIAEKRCFVFDNKGKRLIDWDVPSNTHKGRKGIEFINKGRDLTLNYLLVREWDGQPLPIVDSNNPHIKLTDGSIVSVSRLTEFPITQIEAIKFSTDKPSTQPGDMQLSWGDGTFIKAAISAIEDKTISLQTSFAERSFTASIDALHQIMINTPLQPEPSADQLDKIEFAGISLRGKLVTANEPTIRWQLVGSDKAVAVSRESNPRVSRTFPENVDLKSSPALVYTRYGDIVPATMRHVDKSGVEIRSPVIDKQLFTAEEVRAVQFNPMGRLNITGFEGTGWDTAKSAKHSKKTLRIQPGGQFDHSTLMQASKINFTINSGTSLRLRFFSKESSNSKSTNFLISTTGSSEVFSGIESNGNFVGQYDRTPHVYGKPLKVTFLIETRNIEFQINSITVSKFKIDPIKISGMGMYFEPASVWGNIVQPVSLTDFTAISPPGRTTPPQVDEEIKTQSLTIPRFRRDEPPTHLLIGTNGDVLRGEIKATTTKHYGFRFGMENLNVPRDRVKAVVWLQKPISDQPLITKTPAQKALEVKLNRKNYSTTLDGFVSIIQKEVPDLKIKTPANQKNSNERRRVNMSGKSVELTLYEIAKAFGLDCLVEPDGTVVFESKTITPTKSRIESKSYWMATEAFAKTEAIKSQLSAKGIDFPTGARLHYDADAMMLHSVNTKVNHQQISKVLQSDFGGHSGSPSHWLQLTSGGILAIDVDKFGTEHIIGSTPRLGKCKIPITNVYAISPTAPQANAVLTKASDWQLVHAPEPVLPKGGAGKKTSPLIGKDAPTFKLPLLSGGDFKLNTHKGKVVVLDFWASWCGPCVRALPDFINEMAQFSSDEVIFIGVNQGENGEIVQRFLETRSWKMNVAMDETQQVARQYGVKGIPHTAVIGRDGKVVWVHSGYTPEAAKQAAAAVSKALLVK